MRLKKSLGQHFIKDQEIIDDIIAAAGINQDDTVLEIGAGAGILTAGLAKNAKEVISLEIDERLFLDLKNKFASSTNITFVRGDALLYDYTQIKSPYKIVANIPYYISTPLIFKILENRNKISEITLMLQEELAERLSANPGNKDYGILSIAVQLYADVAFCFKVSKDAFYPKPKIDSAIVKLTVLKIPCVELIDEKLFFRIVKTAFSQRRKTLYNNLKSIFPSGKLNNLFSHFNIDRLRRGETLSIQDFADLSNFISALD